MSEGNVDNCKTVFTYIGRVGSTSKTNFPLTFNSFIFLSI